MVLDEDASHQITLTREGDVIIGVNPVLVLPYVNGRSCLRSDQTCTDWRPSRSLVFKHPFCQTLAASLRSRPAPLTCVTRAAPPMLHLEVLSSPSSSPHRAVTRNRPETDPWGCLLNVISTLRYCSCVIVEATPNVSVKCAPEIIRKNNNKDSG